MTKLCQLRDLAPDALTQKNKTKNQIPNFHQEQCLPVSCQQRFEVCYRLLGTVLAAPFKTGTEGVNRKLAFHNQGFVLPQWTHRRASPAERPGQGVCLVFKTVNYVNSFPLAKPAAINVGKERREM